MKTVLTTHRWIIWSEFSILALLVCILLLPIADILMALLSGIELGYLADTVLNRYILNSLGLAAGVGTLSAMFGLTSAWVITHYRFPGCRFFRWGLLLPLAIPPYIAAYSYGGLLEFAGPVQHVLRDITGWQAGDYWFPPIRSVGGASWVIASVLFPYLYLLGRASFIMQSGELLHSAHMLGVRHRRLFFTVGLPMARPAIVTGVALVIMETLADFGAVQFLAVDTFTTGIYRTWFGRYDPTTARQLAGLLFLTILAVLAMERFSRGPARYAHAGSSSSRQQTRVRGWRAAIAVSLCAIPLMAGFAIPAGQLAWLALQVSAEGMLNSSIWEAMGNSLLVALLAGVIILCLALLLNYLLRGRPLKPFHWLLSLATLGYAIPGVVVAIGAFAPLLWLQTQLNTLPSLWGSEAGTLLITSSVIGLLYAYCIRFLALGYHTIQSGMASVTPQMEWSARMLGASPLQTMTRVHLPLISPSLFAAFLLVFVETFKELPATLILRPFNFDTLATKAYGLASDERLAEAAQYGLLIIVVSMLPVILMNGLMERLSTRERPPHQTEKAMA